VIAQIQTISSGIVHQPIQNNPDNPIIYASAGFGGITGYSADEAESGETAVS